MANSRMAVLFRQSVQLPACRNFQLCHFNNRAGLSFPMRSDKSAHDFGNLICLLRQCPMKPTQTPEASHSHRSGFPEIPRYRAGTVVLPQSAVYGSIYDKELHDAGERNRTCCLAPDYLEACVFVGGGCRHAVPRAQKTALPAFIKRGLQRTRSDAFEGSSIALAERRWRPEAFAERSIISRKAFRSQDHDSNLVRTSHMLGQVRDVVGPVFSEFRNAAGVVRGKQKA